MIDFDPFVLPRECHTGGVKVSTATPQTAAYSGVIKTHRIVGLIKDQINKLEHPGRRKAHVWLKLTQICEGGC